MRCLALAQAWIDAGGHVSFLVRETLIDVVRRLEEENISVHRIDRDDPQAIAKAAETLHADWVVLDGYHFTIVHQMAMRQTGIPLLVVDDHGRCGEYAAEIVLDQNITALANVYQRRSSDTRMLLGTEYVLLRREFRMQSRTRAIAEVARRVLVTFGRGDTAEMAVLTLRAIAQMRIPAVSVKMTVAPPYVDDSRLRAAIDGCDFPVERIATTTRMPELMAWADVAVSATGSTSWELLFMGVPFVGLPLSDDQRPIAQRLHEMRLITLVECKSGRCADEIRASLTALMTDRARRADVMQRGRDFIDGRGPERVMSAMQQIRPWQQPLVPARGQA